FLFPQNLAVPATLQATRQVEIKKEREIKVEKKELKEAGRLATSLDGLEIEIETKVNEVGKLYAAISGQDIVEALKKIGKKIQPEWVGFSSPIKEIGGHEVLVCLPHGFEAKINLNIKAK
ncbi:MAG: 50S ribosomal protein L9, partial [Candidatus Uhrbacteria bacterium GW2011_GWF2_44_350]